MMYKSTLLMIILVFSCLSIYATGWDWALNIGAQSNETAWDLATDQDGNIFVTGSFIDSMQVGQSTLYSNGVTDLFILKLSPTGQLQWAHSFGGSSEDVALSVDTDNTGNCYVTGYFNTEMQIGETLLQSNGSWDAYVIKLNPAGVVVFGKGIGGISNDIGYGISCSGDRVFVTGWFGETIQFAEGFSIQSYGGSDIFVAALDDSGNVLWSKSAGTVGVDYSYKVASDIAGNSYITGVCGNDTAFGNFLLSGDGVFVSKYDINGNFLWASRALSAGVNSIAVNENRGMLTGRLTGAAQFGEFILHSIEESDDIYIAGFDPATGAWQYAESCGGNDSDKGRACHIGDYSVSTGSYSATSNLFGIPNQIANGAYDIYIYVDDRYNPTWDLAQRVITVGGSENDVATDIVITPDNEIIVCGWFSGNCNFGSINLDTGNVANANVFVAKYTMPGTATSDPAAPSLVPHLTFANPFQPNSSLSYALSKNSQVRLGVYNLRGQLISTLQDQAQTAGVHELHWDGKDSGGQPVSSGLYFLQMRTDEGISNHKIMICK